MAGAGNLGTVPEVGGAGTEEARLGKALETYGLAMEKVSGIVWIDLRRRERLNIVWARGSGPCHEEHLKAGDRA